MKLETVLFDSKSSYGKFAHVLGASVAENSPSTPLTIHRRKGQDIELIQTACSYVWDRTAFLDNARKSKYHYELVQESTNGDEICLIDCDTFVLKSLDAIGRMDFDLAITARPRSRYPINTGVVFVRISDKTKLWYTRWYAMVKELMRNKQLIIKTHAKYGGINQCALGLLREQPHDLSIRLLPCEEWNLTADLHNKFQEDRTRVVHVQGLLRQRLINGSPVGGVKIKQLEQIWRQYDVKFRTAST